MKKNMLSLFILLLTLLISSFSYAVTYDMNSMTTGYYSEAQFNSAFSGVSFDNTQGDGFDIYSCLDEDLEPDFSGNAVMNSNFSIEGSSTRATFSESVSFVSVTIGDRNSDADLLYLYAYASDNSLIGSDSFANPYDSYAGTTLIVSSSSANIAYVEFFGVGGLFNSVLWDNFSFEVEDSYNQLPVPEPATIFLLGAGLAGLAGIRKKNRK